MCSLRPSLPPAGRRRRRLLSRRRLRHPLALAPSSAAAPQQHPTAIPEDLEFSIGDSPSLPPELAAGLAEFLTPLEEEASSPGRSSQSRHGGLGGSSRSGLQSFGSTGGSASLAASSHGPSSGGGGGGGGLGSTWSAAAAAAAAAVPLPPSTAVAASGAGLGPGVHGTRSAPVALAAPPRPPPAPTQPPVPVQSLQGSPPAKEGRLRRIFATRTASPALLAETLAGAGRDASPPPKPRGLLRSAKTESPAVLSGLLGPR